MYQYNDRLTQLFIKYGFGYNVSTLIWVITGPIHAKRGPVWFRVLFIACKGKG
jgi:hypothetical protein